MVQTTTQEEEDFVGCRWRSKGGQQLNIEGKVTCTSVQREVALSSISPKEEREMIELFHIKISTKEN
jgi:hypothetical protein